MSRETLDGNGGALVTGNRRTKAHILTLWVPMSAMWVLSNKYIGPTFSIAYKAERHREMPEGGVEDGNSKHYVARVTYVQAIPPGAFLDSPRIPHDS